MKRFVVPPTWPSPPRRSWVPPKTWRPDPSWPPAPEDWTFWVDGKGNAVRGPIGRYAGPSGRAVYAGAAGLVLLLGVTFWALSTIGLFGGDGDQQAVVADDSRSTPSSTPTVTPPLSTPPPVAKTTVPTTIVPPTSIPTQPPTRKPTKSRTTENRTDERPTPTPTPTKTKTTTTPRKTPPPPSTSRPPTQEELLRQYCVQRGWPAEWCDPDNWNAPSDPRSGGH
ncbi:hypothetical protein [Kribbella sp. NPDC055071]